MTIINKNNEMSELTFRIGSSVSLLWISIIDLSYISLTFLIAIYICAVSRSIEGNEWGNKSRIDS